MTNQTPRDRGEDAALTNTELASEQATDLPGREAMSIIAIGDNVAMPINEATAINFGSNYSMAVADADQVVFIDQTDVDPDPSTTDTTNQSGPQGWKGAKNG